MAKLRSCGFLIYRCDAGRALANPRDLLLDPSAARSFLLMKHKKRWDLPKGHVDKGETDMECALRELEEETGIQESDIRVDPGFTYQAKYKVTYKRLGDEPVKKKLIIFLAELIRDVDIEITEHIGFEWFPWAPPHTIQTKTIDPLLSEVAMHWGHVANVQD